MAIINVNDVGKYGVISSSDMSPRHLPLGAWTHAKNVRFAGDHVEHFSNLYETLNSFQDFTPGFATLAIFPVIGADGFQHWAFCGEDAVYASENSADGVITGAAAPYNALEWNGGVFNNLLVINPVAIATQHPIFGTTYPQLWSPVAVGTVLVNLTNWPVNTYCRVIKPFKAYLVAMGIQKAGPTYYTRMVKWSHSADVGVPSSWNEADPTLDAGENNLPYGSSPIIDGVDLGEAFIIYTQEETWMMALANDANNSKFSFRRMLPESGVIAQDCAINITEFPGKHLVVTNNDIILHDLYNVQSVIDKRMRTWFFGKHPASGDLNTSYQYLTRVAHHADEKEVWIGYVKAGADTVIKQALVWNYKTDTWSKRYLPSSRALILSPTQLITMNRVLRSKTIAVGTTDTPFTVYATGPTYTTAQPDAELEREDICVVAGPRGEVTIDPFGKKLIRAIWPKFKTGSTGSALTIYVDTREHEDDTWVNRASGTYAPSTSPKVDLYAQGRFFRIRMGVTNNHGNWELQGYGIDVEPVGAL